MGGHRVPPALLPDLTLNPHLREIGGGTPCPLTRPTSSCPLPSICM